HSWPCFSSLFTILGSGFAAIGDETMLVSMRYRRFTARPCGRVRGPGLSRSIPLRGRPRVADAPAETGHRPPRNWCVRRAAVQAREATKQRPRVFLVG